MKKLVHLLKDESGATAIEYAPIAAAMGLALVAAMSLIATAIAGKVSSLSTHIQTGT